MRFIRWRGGYTDISNATLLAYDAALRADLGFTAVGAPIRRTSGDGVYAMAIYQQATISLTTEAGIINIQAHIRASADFERLKNLTRISFGLKNLPDGRPLGTVEDMES